MVGSGVKGGNGTGTKLFARVAGMNEIRSARTTGVLPQAAALTPVKTKTPKGISGGSVARGGKIQPNPSPDNFRQFVLVGELGFEQVQNGLDGQFAFRVVNLDAFTDF
jgi:hypothetical protein